MVQCLTSSIIAFMIVSLVSSTGAKKNVENPKCGAVSRKGWMGAEPNHVEYLIRPLGLVIVQHTATPSCDTHEECSQRVRNMQHHHMNQLGWSDLGMSFAVGDDGRVYEGPGWLHVGAHTRGYNRKSIAISFIGTFTDELPSEAAMNAARALLACGVRQKHLKSDYKLVAARQLQATESPGMALYEKVQTWPHWTSNIDGI